MQCLFNLYLYKYLNTVTGYTYKFKEVYAFCIMLSLVSSCFFHELKLIIKLSVDLLRVQLCTLFYPQLNKPIITLTSTLYTQVGNTTAVETEWIIKLIRNMVH